MISLKTDFKSGSRNILGITEPIHIFKPQQKLMRLCFFIETGSSDDGYQKVGLQYTLNIKANEMDWGWYTIDLQKFNSKKCQNQKFKISGTYFMELTVVRGALYYRIINHWKEGDWGKGYIQYPIGGQRIVKSGIFLDAFNFKLLEVHTKLQKAAIC